MCSISFNDKPYQEINFKSHLSSVLLVNKKNTVRFTRDSCSCDFILFYLIVLTFAMRLKSANYKSHWNILVFYDQWKIMSDLNMFYGKMPDFVSFPLFGFTLVIKLRNFDFESHWNILIFFNKKRYGVRFEYVPWKNVWFCFISIVLGSL